MGSSFFLHVFLGMSDAPLWFEMSGLSFDSPFLSPLLFFLPSPLALSVWSFFCLWSILLTFFPENSDFFFF